MALQEHHYLLQRTEEGRTLVQELSALLDDRLRIAAVRDEDAAGVGPAEYPHEVWPKVGNPYGVFEPFHLDKMNRSVQLDNAVDLFKDDGAIRFLSAEVLTNVDAVSLEQIVT